MWGAARGGAAQHTCLCAGPAHGQVCSLGALLCTATSPAGVRAARLRVAERTVQDLGQLGPRAPARARIDERDQRCLRQLRRAELLGGGQQRGRDPGARAVPGRLGRLHASRARPMSPCRSAGSVRLASRAPPLLAASGGLQDGRTHFRAAHAPGQPPVGLAQVGRRAVRAVLLLVHGPRLELRRARARGRNRSGQESDS